MKSFKLSCNANRRINQTIRLCNDDYTPEEAIEMLNTGKVTAKRGNLVIIESGKVLGEITECTEDTTRDFYLLKILGDHWAKNLDFGNLIQDNIQHE